MTSFPLALIDNMDYLHTKYCTCSLLNEPLNSPVGSSFLLSYNDSQMYNCLIENSISLISLDKREKFNFFSRTKLQIYHLSLQMPPSRSALSSPPAESHWLFVSRGVRRQLYLVINLVPAFNWPCIVNMNG